MLELILGNRTAAQTLFYLAQHKSGYGTLIAKRLKLPLNMVQKQLEKLARGGLLLWGFIGKKKVFYWNKQSPFFKPLQALLKTVSLSTKAKTLTADLDPANGLYLPIKERLKLAEELNRQAEKLVPYRRYKPFVAVFEDLKAYEAWQKKQTNPWLI